MENYQIVLFISSAILGGGLLLWLIIKSAYNQKCIIEEDDFVGDKENDPLHESSPLQMFIENTTDTDQTCVLFGFSRNFGQHNYGSASGIKITPFFSVSYLECLIESAFSPFSTYKIRIHSENKDQIVEPILSISHNMHGQQLTAPLRPKIPTGAVQEFISEIDTPFDFTFNTFLQFKVFPKTAITITFFIEKKVNVAYWLMGMNPLQKYLKSRQTNNVINPTISPKTK